jgi:hypothetical protein
VCTLCPGLLEGRLLRGLLLLLLSELLLNLQSDSWTDRVPLTEKRVWNRSIAAASRAVGTWP